MMEVRNGTDQIPGANPVRARAACSAGGGGRADRNAYVEPQVQMRMPSPVGSLERGGMFFAVLQFSAER